jgi:hypothetical protein
MSVSKLYILRKSSDGGTLYYTGSRFVEEHGKWTTEPMLAAIFTPRDMSREDIADDIARGEFVELSFGGATETDYYCAVEILPKRSKSTSVNHQRLDRYRRKKGMTP